MKKKTPIKPPTHTELALQLGISRQTLEHHLKSPDAPPLADEAGWHVYLAIRGKMAALPPKYRDAMGVEKLGIARELHNKMKRENAVRVGELISLADARRSATNAASYFWAEMARLEREGPATMHSLTPAELRDKLSAFLKDLRERSREKFKAVAEKE